MATRPNVRPLAPTTALQRPAAGPLESPDQVAWLECRGRSPSSLYEDVHALLQRLFGYKGVLFLIPLHLDLIEGPLSDFVLGLESILQTFPGPVVLGDPSGYATLVLTTLHRDSDVRLYRPSGASARPRRILIVDASGPSPETAVAVLEAFGHSTTLARTGVEARRAIKSSDYELVLLDLDLPRMQSFGIAETLSRQRRATMVGFTSSDEPWASENLERYGFRRILSKPLALMEMLEELA